MSATDRKEIK